jgi:uncharacterized protein (DUF983 family)
VPNWVGNVAWEVDDPMKGSPCPKCGGQVMKYSTFFLKSEPWRRFPCESCGTVLRRSRWGWALVAVGGIGAGVAAVLLTRGQTISQSWPSALVLLIAAVLLINLLAYRLPLWRPVE